MKGKKIVVGVTGGIAAYKAAELVRLLGKADAQVRVAMTKNATEFVSPLTFEALSGERVISDMWAPGPEPMEHITWGQEVDGVIISPATANFVAKMAHGIGDDFLSTMVLAATAKILICPSMNEQMYANSVVQENIEAMRRHGFKVMEPAEGELACGTVGPGRLPEPEDILEEAVRLFSLQDLSPLRFLITAGPTIEPIDPVRFLSNYSSGKMGYALARVAGRRGAEVTLISGPTGLRAPLGVRLVQIGSAEEMKSAVFEHQEQCDVIIKAAAVSDYRPVERAEQKLKKGAATHTLELAKNPDVLAELGRAKGNRRCILVGFAAETEHLLRNAKEKLEQKNLDMIVANDVSRNHIGFGSERNQVKIISRDGHVEDLPVLSKDEVADCILERVKTLWEKKA
jgi:phosphopantothenoylcysteine decarboxylase/phosphopantothenate--cysteine ligase